MENTEKNKIDKIKKKLRMAGILPPYGEFLTEEQELILDQLKGGDYSYWEEFQKQEHSRKQYKPKIYETDINSNVTPKKQTYIKGRLRGSGYLPKYGEPLTEEQQSLVNQIDSGDFTFYYTKVKHKQKTDTEPNCKFCGEQDKLKFYPNGKSKCKKCLLKELKVKYKDGTLDESLKRNKTWMLNNFIHVKVQAAKHRANRKNFEFELTNDIIEDKLKEQDGKCYFSNITLTFNNHDYHSMSLDRMDADIGYTVDNTILVTRFVNNAKSMMTDMEFVNEIKLCYMGIMEKVNS